MVKNRFMKKIGCLIGVLCTLYMVGCRKPEETPPVQTKKVESVDCWVDGRRLLGMYVLNEGNMGSNKSTLDYLDFVEGVYYKNIYAACNPSVVKELGDVGNSMQIYGSKLYIVVNCSHKVEVLNAYTGKRLGKMDIPNCRYITFKDGMGYVSSYVVTNQNAATTTRGAVYRFDTLDLEIKDHVEVGYQPDELVIVGKYAYVANSGGYQAPKYDSTVSVIDLDRFQVVGSIEVAKNLYRIRVDAYDNLWVSSRGDYREQASALFVLAPDAKGSFDGAYCVIDTVKNMGCSTLDLKGDTVYVCGVEWNEKTKKNSISYALVDVKSHTVLSRHFITDGSEEKIQIPYGISVMPVTGDIFVTDATNYVSSGWLNWYSPEGVLKEQFSTGDIPCSMVYLWGAAGQEGPIIPTE